MLSEVSHKMCCLVFSTQRLCLTCASSNFTHQSTPHDAPRSKDFTTQAFPSLFSGLPFLLISHSQFMMEFMKQLKCLFLDLSEHRHSNPSMTRKNRDCSDGVLLTAEHPLLKWQALFGFCQLQSAHTVARMPAKFWRFLRIKNPV